MTHLLGAHQLHPFSGCVKALMTLEEVPVSFVRPVRGIGNDALPALRERPDATCIEQLASFKRPVEIRFVQDFPRSTLEKIAKAQLRELLF